MSTLHYLRAWPVPICPRCGSRSVMLLDPVFECAMCGHDPRKKTKFIGTKAIERFLAKCLKKKVTD